MKSPFLSIIIPTRNSSDHLDTCLQSIKKMIFPKGDIEIIVADNQSGDKTIEIARKYMAKIVHIRGIPPRVCEQRNSGALKAKGDYLYFFDHDMDLPINFFTQFRKQVNETNGSIDAWQVPEITEGNTDLMSEVKSFEKQIYTGTPISACRIIKRTVFFKTPDQYDILLSSGPADWDMEIQLKSIGAKTGTVKVMVCHHEELLGIDSSVRKKVQYFRGLQLYEKKWQECDSKMYAYIMRTQMNVLYRYLVVFFENGKWKMTLSHLHLYLVFLIYKLYLGIFYLYFKLYG